MITNYWLIDCDVDGCDSCANTPGETVAVSIANAVKDGYVCSPSLQRALGWSLDFCPEHAASHTYTVEQLEQLPDGSIVVAATGLRMVRADGYWHGPVPAPFMPNGATSEWVAERGPVFTTAAAELAAASSVVLANGVSR